MRRAGKAMAPNCGRSKDEVPRLSSRATVTHNQPSAGFAVESADFVRISAKTGWFRAFHLC
jgi:hypothetical protein